MANINDSSASVFDVIDEATELMGGLAQVTRQIPSSQDPDAPSAWDPASGQVVQVKRPAGQSIVNIQDKIYSTTPNLSIDANAMNINILSVQVESNKTVIFTGLAGSDCDGLRLAIQDNDGNVIYDSLPGSLVGSNIYEWVYKAPHVMVSGKTYNILASNYTNAAITPELTARALKLSY